MEELETVLYCFTNGLILPIGKPETVEDRLVFLDDSLRMVFVFKGFNPKRSGFRVLCFLTFSFSLIFEPLGLWALLWLEEGVSG